MEKNTLINLIKKECLKVFDKYNDIYPDKAINPDTISYKFNLRGTIAGKASFTDYTLYFNLILAENNLLDFFNDTIPHEIAHLYQRKFYPDSKPHGIEWRDIMLEGDYNPLRCHSYDTQIIKQARKPKNKFVYICNCGKTFKLTECLHNRIKKGSGRICKTCKGKIFYTGHIVTI